MKAIFKITRRLLEDVRTRLSQSHGVAYERVGFLSCGVAFSANDTLVILARKYHPVSDDCYHANPTVGACINRKAISMAMQIALSESCSMFHVHLHSHKGATDFSDVDVESNRKLIPDFFNVASNMPHGAIVFSHDKGKGMVWLAKDGEPVLIDEYVVVGSPMSIWSAKRLSDNKKFKRDFSRQSFLGPESRQIFSRTRVGVVGLGGGGSHVIQQLAHIGIGRYVICDDDIVENSNLNRLVGATQDDVRHKRPKTEIATRIIGGLMPDAEVSAIKGRWGSALDDLAGCFVIFGCLDSFKERDELERFCRRNHIPHIDIGMVVSKSGKSFRISGQVVLSMPDGPCLKCMCVLKDEKIEEETRSYGAAGSQPQVVWSNGILASSAVGILVDLVCPWKGNAPSHTRYLEYNGNEPSLGPSPRCQYIDDKKCAHYPMNGKDIGDPFFDINKFTIQTTRERPHLVKSCEPSLRLQGDIGQTTVS